MYSSDKLFTIYCKDCWFSDKWDALTYGREYNFSKSFFEQIRALKKVVPLLGLSVETPTVINSDYVNAAGNLKNCYLIFHAGDSENCSYSDYLVTAKDSYDCLNIYESELCFECVNIRKCYQTRYSVDCEDSNDLTLCLDCTGCQGCFGCAGLRKRQFCIFNVQYSEAEYRERIKQMNVSSYEKLQTLKKEAAEVWLKTPRKFMHGRNNQDVTGDYIDNSKNAKNSFHVLQVENCKYVGNVYLNAKDCYDYNSWGDGSQLIYEVQNSGQQIYNLQFVDGSWDNCMNHQYCSEHCLGGSNLFGCVGLRKKQYCILNKQYSKEEYEALVPKIIEHMNTMPYTDAKGRVYTFGEFFPFDMSPFGYNESMAMEYFPLTEAQANEMGLKWKAPEVKQYEVTLKSSALPDDSKDAPESLSREIIGCEHVGKCAHRCSQAFKILAQDVVYYKKMGVPLPRLCPNCRSNARMEYRNPMKLWTRECACAGSGHSHGTQKCPNKFETSYAPERPEIIYCGQCYQSEVA